MSASTSVSSPPGCTYTIKPDNDGYVPPGTCGYYGKMYKQSTTLAAVFSAIAGVILLGHLWKAITSPRDGLRQLAVFVAACLLSGYIARAVGTHQQQNVWISAFSDTMVLICPTLITAFDGILLVRAVQHYAPNGKILSLGYPVMSKLVTIITALLVVVQLGTCAAIVTGNPPAIQVAGIRIYMATIATQEVVVLLLLGLTVKLHSTMSRFNDSSNSAYYPWTRWKLISAVLCISLFAISIRIVYRLIELSMVFQAHRTMPHKEAFFYCFEAAPVLFALSVLVVVPTGNLTSQIVRNEDYEYREIQGDRGERQCSQWKVAQSLELDAIDEQGVEL